MIGKVRLPPVYPSLSSLVLLTTAGYGWYCALVIEEVIEGRGQEYSSSSSRKGSTEAQELYCFYSASTRALTNVEVSVVES